MLGYMLKYYRNHKLFLFCVLLIKLRNMEIAKMYSFQTFFTYIFHPSQTTKCVISTFLYERSLVSPLSITNVCSVHIFHYKSLQSLLCSLQRFVLLFQTTKICSLCSFCTLHRIIVKTDFEKSQIVTTDHKIVRKASLH
jgi:hypothetical protein